MAIASITTWLNSKERDFYHGRMLFEQYGSDPLVLAIIKSGSGSFHFSKLLQGLEELNKSSNIEPKPIQIPELPDPEKDDGKWTGAPDPILEIRNEKNLRYAQARQLFGVISVTESQEHRIGFALQLLDHMDFVDESWGAIDEWRETGQVREIKKVQEVASVADLTLKELLQESKNIASYISKDRKKLAEEKNPKRIIKIKARLELREIRLAEIKRRMDEIDW